jgi:Ran GTPase-activating protein (RanGAP) involved in mRNA processing and transport
MSAWEVMDVHELRSMKQQVQQLRSMQQQQLQQSRSMQQQLLQLEQLVAMQQQLHTLMAELVPKHTLRLAIEEWRERQPMTLNPRAEAHLVQLLEQRPVSGAFTLVGDCLFAAALAAVPIDDWVRTWPAHRTIMLRMTSKTIKDAVDKLCLPTVLMKRRTTPRPNSMYDCATTIVSAERLHDILTQLEKLTTRCRITTLDLSWCNISGKDLEFRITQRNGEDMQSTYINLTSPAGEDVRVPVPSSFLYSAQNLFLFEKFMVQRLVGVIAQCPALSRLYLGSNFIGAEGAGMLAGVLAQCPTLSYLDLGYNQIGAHGAGRLAGALNKCRLWHLNLSGNALGDEGADRLAEVLSQCTALKSLSLNSNEINALGAGRLARVLPTCPALSHLYLRRNQIQDVGARSLAGVLPQCSMLSHLFLGSNNITAVGAGSLVGVLPKCPALSRLYLSSNAIGMIITFAFVANNGGMGMLAEMLEAQAFGLEMGMFAADAQDLFAQWQSGRLYTSLALGNERLSHLDLSRNFIGDEAAGRLAGVLAQCPALSRLNLSTNHIGDDGAGSFAGVLMQCPALSFLYLASNNIGDQGARRLEEVLAHHSTRPGAPAAGPSPALSYLDLRHNQIGSEGSSMLQAACRGRPFSLRLDGGNYHRAVRARAVPA